jgi:hypothetical protein
MEPVEGGMSRKGLGTKGFKPYFHQEYFPTKTYKDICLASIITAISEPSAFTIPEVRAASL